MYIHNLPNPLIGFPPIVDGIDALEGALLDFSISLMLLSKSNGLSPKGVSGGEAALSLSDDDGGGTGLKNEPAGFFSSPLFVSSSSDAAMNNCVDDDELVVVCNAGAKLKDDESPKLAANTAAESFILY